MKRIKKVGAEIYKAFQTSLDISIYTAVGAGAGNCLGGLEDATMESMHYLYGQGFVNHLPVTLLGSLTYPISFNYLENKRHFRAYANIVPFAMAGTFALWHYFAGTEFPLHTVLLNLGITISRANVHVTRRLEKKKLEEIK